MSATTPEKCLKCGARFFREESDGWGDKVISYTRFICETTVYSESKELRLQGHFCLLKERDQLAERIKELEDAGDELFMRISCGCGTNGCEPCNKACGAWFKAKGLQ